MVIIKSYIGFLGPKKKREAYVLVPLVIFGMNYLNEMHSKNHNVHGFKYQNRLEYGKNYLYEMHNNVYGFKYQNKIEYRNVINDRKHYCYV